MIINTNSQEVGPESNDIKDTLLIVEDNKDMLFFLTDHFESKYNVLSSMDGESGWQRIQQSIPDIVISDLMMPGIDGIQLCHLLKTNLATAHIPFVLLTAKDTDESKIIGFKTGADDYVCKPFNIDLLEVRVENLFANRKRLQQAYLQSLTQSLEKNEPLNDPFVDQIISYINENITEVDLNVEKLSIKLHMSRITLYRKVKALTGLTVIELIRSVRLQRAAELLKKKQSTINEVCYSVGFSDVDYFRKIFKGMFGMVPSEYR